MLQLLLKIGTTFDQMFMWPEQHYYATFWSQKMSALHCSSFSQKSPNCRLVYFLYRQKNTLTSSKFKNQTNDIFKLLGYNYNY